MKLYGAALLAIASLRAGEDDAARLLARAQADLAAGRYAAAIDAGKKAAAAFHNRADRNAEGRSLNSVGLAQLYSGDYASSFDTFVLALNIARESHDGDGELTRLNNLGTVFYFQGRYGDALARYQEALRRLDAYPHQTWTASRRQLTVANIAILYQTLGQFQRALDLYSELMQTPQALPPREQAQLLSNIGSLRRRLGDPQKALETYRAAQDLYRKAAHRDGEIAVLNNIGIVQAMDLHDYSGAAVTFSDALRLAELSGDRPRAIHARLYRGEAFYRNGSNDKSASDFQTAADEAAALGEREEAWKAIYGLARIASKSGDVSKANQLLDQAAGHIESMRSGLGSSLRSDFLADKRDVYDLLIEHTTGASDIFQWMERSRARSLQDRISPAKIPDLKTLAVSLPPDTAVLEYWLGGSSGAVLWVSASRTGVRRWALSKEDLDALTVLPSVLADPQRADWREAANRVSKIVLGGIPVLKQPGIRRLIIVPDGALTRVPFEALPLEGSGALVERFTVSYLPAALLFNGAAGRRRILWPWQRTLEAFGDPSPGVAGHALELAGPRAWSRLPAAASEVTVIARILGGSTGVHIGSDARKEFLQRAPLPAVVHFATHAYADPQNPDQSYILLAPAASSSQRFDYLFLKEVNGLSLRGVDLVTASACETEAGKFVRGEGVESFGRAFLAAGARSAVTSLWDVSDRRTAQIMVSFYTELGAGRAVADALRTAKLQFLARTETAHPAYWAGFLLHGESGSRIPFVIRWTWIALPPLLLACAALFFRTWARKV